MGEHCHLVLERTKEFRRVSHLEDEPQASSLSASDVPALRRPPNIPNPGFRIR